MLAKFEVFHQLELFSVNLVLQPSVRKQHNSGYKHKANVRSYYQQYEAQLNQSLIDQRVKEHLVAFRAPAPPYAQMRPGLPVFPTPGQNPMAGNPQLPAGYVSGPPMPSMVAPPGAPMPGQVNSLPRPPMGAPTSLPGSAGMATPTGAPPMYAPPPMPQGGIPVPTSAAGDSSSNSQVPPEPNH
nr:U1 small nuclear ribonucleoprotein C-like [Ipomoea batatas]